MDRIVEKKTDKQRKEPEFGASRLGTHRSALYNLYKDYGQIIPEAMGQVLASSFKGIKRTRTKEQPEGS